jgi:hypothetical protein
MLSPIYRLGLHLADCIFFPLRLGITYMLCSNLSCTILTRSEHTDRKGVEMSLQKSVQKRFPALRMHK